MFCNSQMVFAVFHVSLFLSSFFFPCAFHFGFLKLHGASVLRSLWHMSWTRQTSENVVSPFEPS